MINSNRLLVLGVMAAMVVVGSVDAAPMLVPPDLTHGVAVDHALTYNLGATGMRGWIFTQPTRQFDFEGLQGRTTAVSRQILVTHVGVKSPADGVMKVGDVIIGVNGKPFSDDARKSIALAIQQAEQETSGGVLKLTRWQAGKTTEVQIKLRVMGTYSATAPYDCPKSKRILEEASKVLEHESLKGNWCGAVNGLALLATGNPAYLPRLRTFARGLVPAADARDEIQGSAWEMGYRNIFLTEYFLLTGDQEVMPAIRHYTLTLAHGQGMYGTFGHGFSDRTAEGKLHGSIPPYGPVNAAGLPANLAIVLGKKCGVEDPEVDGAIERASKFFGYYVDKGAVPYGEHLPWPYFENNGKNAMAAVMFAAQGTRAVETQYFAKMVTASFKNRESGHTGQGFSYLWAGLGANTGGPAAAAAYFKEASWHYDLVRRCDGSFTYDGREQYGPGATDDDTYFGNSSYDGLSPAATYVLTYSMPLKNLCITGKGENQSNWLDKSQVEQSIAGGHFDLERLKKSPQQLVESFGDSLPIVRSWAASELAKRPEAVAMVPALIAMAEGSDAHVRQGACEALGAIPSDAAVPVLARLLTHDDRWLRIKAAQALKNQGDRARPSISAMLVAAVKNAEPLEPIVWSDPIQINQTELAMTLFAGRTGLLRGSEALHAEDSALLYPAIRAFSMSSDGMARSQFEQIFPKFLTLADVMAMGPDLLAAVYRRAPADTMFDDSARLAALQALVKYHFQEGIRASVDYVKSQVAWASEMRTPVVMTGLQSYGTAARDALPELKDFLVVCRNETFPEDCKRKKIAAVEAAILSIESATRHPELQSFGPVPAK